MQPVSIHAPHEGERHIWDDQDKYYIAVSIHAPHEGERPAQGFVDGVNGVFQSTLPTRGSDGVPFLAPSYGSIVSIHAPHEGERPKQQRYSII